jgi:ABC-type amino acid transport substrate-binding protein
MVRRILFLTAFVIVSIGLSDRSLSACGDKFLVLGRSIGYNNLLKASKPANIVLFSTPRLPSVFSDGRFDLLMEVAGHRLTTVSDRRTLERALATGKVDLVLADSGVSREIGGYVTTSSSALVVPILVPIEGSDRMMFEKEFGCVLRLPTDSRKVIDALDKAMKLRAKRIAARTA